MFMPNACFPFFFNVYMDYLRSQDAREDADAASCFFSLVDFKCDQIQCLDKWITEKTIETLQHLGLNQSFYDAKPDVYGSFEDRAAKTLEGLA